MHPISHRQVLQRDHAGMAHAVLELPKPANVKVVAVSEDGEIELTVRRAGGRFAEIDGLPAGGPYTITATEESGGPAATVADVLVGDLWVLAGQSNMQGIGEISERLPPLSKAAMLSFDRTWKPAVEPLHRFWETMESAQYKMSPHLGFGITKDELDRAYEQLHAQDAVEPVGGVGPGAFFAESLIRRCGVPIGLLPCALSGSPLDMWQKDFCERTGDSFEDTLFGDLVDRVQLAGGRVAGVLWYQGESDALPGTAETYLQRFEKFVDDIRISLDDPGLPFITVQLANTENIDEWTREDAWNRLRDSQRLAAELIENVDVVSSADLPRNDHVHLSGKGQRALGMRLAKAASRRTSSCRSEIQVPALDAIDIGSSSLVVRFRGVNGRLRVSGGELSKAFTVTGRQIVGARLSGSTVEVLLDGPCRGGEAVSFGMGFQPAAMLLDDEDFAVPVFGPIRPTTG